VEAAIHVHVDEDASQRRRRIAVGHPTMHPKEGVAGRYKQHHQQERDMAVVVDGLTA
jgi:hypothetical protein